jgi:predicted DNA-binding antitoxin AbrB/MazE fold protein
MKTLLAHFDGKALIPDEPVDLPTGRALRVQVTEVERPRLTREQIEERLRSFVPVPREDVEELERLIKEGQQPIDYRGAFDEK